MCRFLAYLGPPVFLESLLVAPPASLIAQSLSAREAKTIVNADGCGIGWYGELDEPGAYHGLLPAWSDHNLASLCRQLRCRMFAAHVRSATSGEVAAANCHPFVHGNQLFMHNGQIGDYERIRRRVDSMIPDQLYPSRRGSSDSEVIFLAAIGRAVAGGIVDAMRETLGVVLGTMRDAGITKPLRFAAVHADGRQLRCFRWSSDERAPTLYWTRQGSGFVAASEPFDANPGWHAVDPDTVVTFSPGAEPYAEPFEVSARAGCQHLLG